MASVSQAIVRAFVFAIKTGVIREVLFGVFHTADLEQQYDTVSHFGSTFSLNSTIHFGVSHSAWYATLLYQVADECPVAWVTLFRQLGDNTPAANLALLRWLIDFNAALCHVVFDHSLTGDDLNAATLVALTTILVDYPAPAGFALSDTPKNIEDFVLDNMDWSPSEAAFHAASSSSGRLFDFGSLVHFWLLTFFCNFYSNILFVQIHS